MNHWLLVLPLLLAAFARGAPAQPAQTTQRFSLRTEVLALSNCVAQPGNVPVPLTPGDLNLEVVNWLSAPAPTNHTAEFLLQFNGPRVVGSVMAYEPGQITFLSDQTWAVLPPVDGAGRKLQVIPFPPGVQVQAVKFSVPARSISGPADDVGIYRASLPFATFLPLRVVNIAGDAVASASSIAPGNRPAVLNDGLLGPVRNFATAPRPDLASSEKPEWLQLTWDRTRDFRGVAFFHGRMETGAGHAVFETLRGAGDPGASNRKEDWDPMRLRSTAPGRFGANQFFVSMQTLHSRALRITSTGTVSQITLGEIVVLNLLPTEATTEPPKTVEPKS